MLNKKFSARITEVNILINYSIVEETTIYWLIRKKIENPVLSKNEMYLKV
jgi:hypothetical protein